MKPIKRTSFLTLITGILLFTGSCDVKDKLVTNDPGNMTEFRGNNGLSYEFTVKGDISGSVWGGQDGYYTDDSDLSTAAVHAGVLSLGETGKVKVTIRPGRDEYFGSTQHGVTSSNYGSWVGSYEFE